MKKLKVILLGAGDRGRVYTDIMAKMPEKYEVIAVADPIDNFRNYVKQKHSIPDDMCFDDWKPLLGLGKIADVAIIATMDREHTGPALAAIEAGYDLLLEKPIAPTAEDCTKITEAAKKKGTKIIVCTVLRYTDLFCTIKNIIDSGKIGKVVSINHEECLANAHQSHSFVRSNWGNESRSSTMLLQKSCHDIDLIQWLLGKKCQKVQSYGFLSYFKEENAPEGSPDYCIDGCPVAETCPFNATKIYLKDPEEWMCIAATKNLAFTREEVEEALRNTQCGKCVFKCDNDVVDHQTVNMLFEDDITVTFTMNSFSEGGRFMHIMGTKGELRAKLYLDATLTHFDFATKQKSDIAISVGNDDAAGHGGGDTGLVTDLYDYITEQYKGKSVPTIEDSYYNHMIVFAAEESRLGGGVVDFNKFFMK